MKHQYFGDENDYRKYGLLRALCDHGGLRLGVCWMLTENDDRADGLFTSYLREAHVWRRYDPELFDALTLAMREERHLRHVEGYELLPGAVFVDGILRDDRQRRSEFFHAAQTRLAGVELVFFDPDNGLEIASRPVGRKDSSKYLLWVEASATFAAGHSVLIYQHFPHENRDRFITRISHELQTRTGASTVLCLRTAHVAFFLLVQQPHMDSVRRAAAHLSRRWGDQFEILPKSRT